MHRYAKPVQRTVALVGAAAMLWAAVDLSTGPQPEWLWPAFPAWCIGVPYWHYLEYRLFAPDSPEARRRFLEQQSLSRTVWAGGALVLVVALLRGP